MRLLPRRFKKLAYSLLALSILFITFSVTKVIAIDDEIAKTIFRLGVLLSFLLLALTRDKIEDELTLVIRLKALASSFIFGVGYVVVSPFVSWLFDGEFIVEDLGIEGLLLTMFLFYFGMFGLMKRNR
ncbi:hypothetical protein SAMN05444285_13710 [Draconibacterium orientale]|uniref:Uncharacterized protein n=1 Tax=Draconibacterium orientale TaxID=1168034 RepID=A0A1I0J2U3_9BACT|nr:hypothetical protein SAMN05444285_13710 [Draconibacterium orientale]